MPSERGNALDALFPDLKMSQADHLIALAHANTVGLCRTPGGDSASTYATMRVGEHQETWAINSETFRLWLSRIHYTEYGKAPNANALKDAVAALDADARFGEFEYPVAVRAACWDDEAIYLDLADADWNMVRITDCGWKIIDAETCPGYFVRRSGIRPLALPARGGSIDELRSCLNVPSDDAWRLLVGWMLMALNPHGPFPLLCVDGEQGSGKTGLCRMVRDLLDPNAAPLRRPPRNEQDLMIAANNGWIVAYDNLSGIKPELSDALCGLATGTGFATRTLYSNDEETIFSARRPIIVNGIENLASRSDLADRTVHLTLPTIPATERRSEAEIKTRFDAMRGRVLGALLDGVVEALRNRSSVRLDASPRMADFALWVTAAESALGWEPGAFMQAYENDRNEAHMEAVESSCIGPAVLKLVGSQPGHTWSGTATELLIALRRVANISDLNRQGWPASPKGVSGGLRRLAPNIRACGVEVEFLREANKERTRTIRLSRVDATQRPGTADASTPKHG